MSKEEQQVRARVASAIKALDPFGLGTWQIAKLRRLARRVERAWGEASGRELLYNASLAVTVLPIKDVFLALRDEWDFLDELYRVEWW